MRGDGLSLSYRDTYSIPIWRFRYRFAGTQRIVNIGSYRDASLASTRKKAYEQSVKDVVAFNWPRSSYRS